MVSTRRLLVAGRLLVPDGVIGDESGGAFVEVEDGVVARLGLRAAVEVPAAAAVEALGNDTWLCPGFVDLQVNGGGGADVMSGAEAVAAAGRAHLARGVTAWCPTVITAPRERLLRAIEDVASAVERAERTDPAGLPACLGIHVEGPFLALGARGVHDAMALRDPDLAEVDAWQAAAGGRVRLVTLAPELDGGLEAVRGLVARGIAVSIGHTEATTGVVRAAADAGARLVTHLFNAMRPLHHREVGPIGIAFLDERLHPAVIADGLHVGADALRLFHRLVGTGEAAGTGRAGGAGSSGLGTGGRGFLVTDAASPAGLPPFMRGPFTLGLAPVAYESGRVTDAAGRLAGSALTMDVAVATYAQLAGASAEAALQMATGGPARALAAGLIAGRLQREETQLQPGREVRAAAGRPDGGDQETGSDGRRALARGQAGTRAARRAPGRGLDADDAFTASDRVEAGAGGAGAAAPKGRAAHRLALLPAWHRLVPAGALAVGAPADLVAVGPDLGLRAVYRLGRRVGL